MSDCCCCCPPPTPGGGGDGGTPPPPPRCTKYQVTITSIDVSAIDDGFLGGTLETTWTFVVNGQVQTYVNNDLDVGVTAIGISFFVDVPSDTSTISLQVGAVEHDPIFDDVIAGFTQVWGQAQSWGLGTQSGSASDSNITYRLNYQITCAQKGTVSISRDVLMAYGREKAETRKKAVAASDSTLLSWALDRVRRANWDLVQATDQHYIFKGYGKFPVLLERKFARAKREK
jgi:hypothetical protein